VTQLRRNFASHEFVCKHCRLLVGPDDVLLDVLQRARDQVGQPLRIVSGYRCALHNRVVGGSKSSQHVLGRAADVPGGYATASMWRSYGAIGIGVRDGEVVHVDTRRGSKSFVFDD